MRLARTPLVIWVSGILLALPACSSPGRTGASSLPHPNCIRPDTPIRPDETLPEQPRTPTPASLPFAAADSQGPLPFSHEEARRFFDDPHPNAVDPCPDEAVWGWRLKQSRDRAWGDVCEFIDASWQDQLRYYSLENLGLLALGVAVAAPLANTPADREFRNWYQQDVRSEGLDRCAAWAKGAGDHLVVLPAYLGAACLGRMFDDTAAGSAMHAWGCRTLRATIVGGPSVGVLQLGLGSGRPVEDNSHWNPFNDKNAVAGHGFVGAVPFLAAASLTENPWLRAPLVAASFATCWSRINDDAHYLSQALLGWWIAYLSVRTVDDTDRARRTLHLLPGPEGSLGASVLMQY